MLCIYSGVTLLTPEPSSENTETESKQRMIGRGADIDAIDERWGFIYAIFLTKFKNRSSIFSLVANATQAYVVAICPASASA